MAQRFLGNSSLSARQKKYCGCLLDVAAKQEGVCQRAQWGQPGCYHLYKLCAKSTHTSSHNCSDNYDFLHFSDADLKAYAQLQGLDIAEPFSRATQLDIIDRWKRTEGKSIYSKA